MKKFIPLSVPNINGNEIDYVNAALKAEWVSTAGAKITEFEESIKNYTHAYHACAVQSGTAGLHLSLLACGVKKNEEVIVPTLTFIAAVNPVCYIGASPIFMDCDDSLCMDPIKLEKFIVNNCTFKDSILINNLNGKRIRAILIVHVFGNLADMVKIMQIANDYNLMVIEDATEALGSFYTDGPLKGKFAGTIGDIGVYSFNGNKIITTGGGGMFVTNDIKLYEHAKHLSTQAKADVVRFIHDEIGYNYRMTNIQAAMGLAQLERLEDFISIKIKNYNLYKSHFSNEKLELISFRKGTRSNHWFYSLNLSKLMISYDNLMEYLSKQGIQTRPVWSLIHHAPMYLDNESYNIEKAVFYQENILNLPCSTNLSTEDVNDVISYILEYVK